MVKRVLIINHPYRSGENWLVGRDGYSPHLKASVGDDPTIPPSSGWHFPYGQMLEDVTCSPPPVDSPPCNITVSLTGLAKETQGECEGRYRDTGLTSSGRQVANKKSTSPPSISIPF